MIKIVRDDSNIRNHTIRIKDIPNFCSVVASAIGKRVKNPVVLVASDNNSSKQIRKRMIHLFSECGINVVDADVSTKAAVLHYKKDKHISCVVFLEAERRDELPRITLFGKNGKLMPEDRENRILEEMKVYNNEELAIAGTINEEKESYKDYAKSVIDLSRSYIDDNEDMPYLGLKVGIESSSTGFSRITKYILETLGADVKIINGDSKSVHNLDRIAKFIKENKYSIGIFYDNSVHQLFVIDEEGNKYPANKLLGYYLSHTDNTEIENKIKREYDADPHLTSSIITSIMIKDSKRLSTIASNLNIYPMHYIRISLKGDVRWLKENPSIQRVVTDIQKELEDDAIIITSISEEEMCAYINAFQKHDKANKNGIKTGIDNLSSYIEEQAEIREKVNTKEQ